MILTGSFFKTVETLANYSSLGKFPVSAVLWNSALKVFGELFLKKF